MDTKSMTRKEFVTLTFTLLGGAATAAACSSSSNSTGTGGTNGTGGTSANGCTSPLPETQLSDQTGHTHTVSIPASDLDSTTDMTIDTNVVSGHMHSVTLTVANLGTIKAGGTVDVVSTVAGTPAHMHTFRVSCTAGASVGVAGNGGAGTSGAAGASGAAGSSGAAGINGAAGH